MLDWLETIRQRLGRLGLAPEREDEIVAELAAHLEEACEGWLGQGLPAEEAIARTLRDVADGGNLRREIRHAEREEKAMNHRTKSVWLPGLITLAFSASLLWALQQAGARPVFLWINPNIPLLFYVPWLLSLPVAGAIGAYWSRRIGGQLAARIAAGLFPAAVMAGFFILILPLAFILDRHVPCVLKFTALAINTLNWVVVPGAALLVGTLPLLKNHHREPSRCES